MSPVEVKNYVFELFGGKIHLTAITFDNSEPRYLEQIFISYGRSKHRVLRHRTNPRDICDAC